jgi:hypothetical protein
MNNKQVVICTDTADVSSIRIALLMQQGRDTSTVKYVEDELVTAYYNCDVYPIELKDELTDLVKHRQSLKQAFDASLKNVFILRNRIGKV